MKRRTFLQAAVAGAGFGVAKAYGLSQVSSTAARSRLDDFRLDLAPIDLHKIPQIISIFLYGGASELAGNLSNIGQIMRNSSTPYPPNLAQDAFDTQVTRNQCWANAGGTAMEQMLRAKQMSIYRTVNRVLDDSKAHGLSVTQSASGNVDSSMPGIATTLAYILTKNNPFLTKPVEQLVMPFVSFEGESHIFSGATEAIPRALRPVSLSATLQNPYERVTVGGLPDGHTEDQLTLLAKEMALEKRLFPEIGAAFSRRADLAKAIKSMVDESFVKEQIRQYNIGYSGADLIDYGESDFAAKLRAAVGLALINNDTVFISLSGGGVGQWDDHSDGLVAYPKRMNSLMSAIRAAVLHIERAASDKPHARNILINVYSEFGRNVSLNASRGWDHGNNQSFMTFAGANLRPIGALGKVVGRTTTTGSKGDFRQFTTPSPNSYQCEPYAIASRIYSYFGVRNPQVLTGVTPLDETVASEPVLT